MVSLEIVDSWGMCSLVWVGVGASGGVPLGDFGGTAGGVG